MSHAYRSASSQHVIDERLSEILVARARLEPLWGGLRAVKAKRVARVISGSVGVFGTALMIAVAFWFLVDPSEDRERASLLTYLLVGSSAVASISYGVTRLVFALMAGPDGMTRQARLRQTLTGDLEDDLAKLDAHHPQRAMDRALSHLDSNLETWSVALPLVAMSLLAPLMIHLPFAVVFGGLSERRASMDYARWIQISMAIVGHAHVALAVMAVRYAFKMRASTLDELRRLRVGLESCKAVGVTILASCLPGIFLYGIPPVLTLMTALAFVPLMFVAIRARIAAERGVLHATMLTADAHVAPECAGNVHFTSPLWG